MIARPYCAGGNRGSRPLISLGLALVALLGAARADAHGAPTPLDFWGDFTPAIARCQREIGRRAAACAQQAWRVRRRCLLGELAGAPCDAAAAAAAVEAARRDSTPPISAACTEQQIASLQFLGVFEAQSDAVRFCRELDTAVVSVAVAPPLTRPQLSPAEQDCAAATTHAATKLLHAAFRSRQRLLDRIAVNAFSPKRKRDLVARSTADIAAAAAALRRTLDGRCTAETFAALYGRGVDSFLAAIASRADCLAGDTYAQAGIVCPMPVCGNAIEERGEECDDGNTLSGDGCSEVCLRG